MNFALAGKLTELLEKKELDKAIGLAESELGKVPATDFHKIIGRNLIHLKFDLKTFITNFNKTTIEVLNKKQGFLKSIFGKKDKLKPVAYYCEMNGFTINYDRWFIDLFSFEKYNPTGWDWLSDFYDSTSKSMTITGFEDIQRVFKDVHENSRLKEENINEAYEICELIVILRLQELFREAYKQGEHEWIKIPMFVTSHDYEMIYSVN